MLNKFTGSNVLRFLLLWILTASKFNQFKKINLVTYLKRLQSF